MHAHWHSPTRHYTAHLQQDLFGTWVLVRAWGSRSSRHGNACVEPFSSHGDGLSAFADVVNRRLKRGYQLVAWQN